MLKPFFEAIKTLINITDDTKKNKEDNKALQTKFESMNNDLNQIACELLADRRVATEQRENLLLRVEAALRDNPQRALPTAPASQEIIAVILTRLDALEKENEALKRQFEEWKSR